MISRRNEALSPYTTLGLGGPAATFLEPSRESELIEALLDAEKSQEPVLLLGGGSNLVVADEGFAGAVIKLGASLAETTISRDDAAYIVDAGAGRPWDEFVEEMVMLGASGVESLSGIPGLVGATPMQNVGAYGQEVSQSIEHVRVYDRSEKVTRIMQNQECAFGYRESVFRGSDRYAILSVRFRLLRSEDSAPIRYDELSRALGVSAGQRAPLRKVRETVVALRRAKGMVVDAKDPESRSAGSFFKNPIVDNEEFHALEARVFSQMGGAKIPSYPDTQAPANRRKIAAAWLIEHAGFHKGHGGRIRISKKHALSLVNGGGGTATELVELARSIRAKVRDVFGVTLEAEPIFVGLSL